MDFLKKLLSHFGLIVLTKEQVEVIKEKIEIADLNALDFTYDLLERSYDSYIRGGKTDEQTKIDICFHQQQIEKINSESSEFMNLFSS